MKNPQIDLFNYNNIDLQKINLFKSNFLEIKNFFQNLNEDLNHFENSNDICTPIECVKEMVDAVPQKFWQKKDLKILDCCCGNGNFHSYILQKTELKNLYFNEINEKRIANVKKIFGKNINLTRKDFLSFENKEEFDLVVANPPYAKFSNEKRTAKNHNLSRDFILKAIEITKKNGYILFIVPNNWMSFSDRNILPKILSNYQFIHINIGGAKKYFPKVGSSFTWFLLQKCENKNEFIVENNYFLKDKQKARIEKNVNFIPLYHSNIVASILQKTINGNHRKYKIETSSDLHKYTKASFLSDKKDDIFKHKIIHTPSQIFYSKKPHKFQDGFKVFISLTNQYQTFIDEAGMTQSIAFIRCNSKNEAIKIKQELDNDIYKFLNNITRYGNFNNIRVLQNFPILCDFNFEEKELELIEKFNKIYYEKKE